MASCTFMRLCTSPRQHFINIFLSENITPRELIFLAKIYLGLSSLKFIDTVPQVLIISKQEVKTVKNSFIFKNLPIQNHKCQKGTTSSFKIAKTSFLKFVQGNFL
jgi:hypothetical protein